MGKRLLIFLLFITLGVGGFASVAVYADEGEAAKPKAAAEGEGTPAKDAPKPEAKGGEGGGGKSKGPSDVSGGRFAGDPVFVHLAPLILPIISDQGVQQIVMMQITLEILDVEVADDVHSNMPRVRDALMRALYGGLGKGSLRDGKLVDITKVKAKTAAALDELLGPGKVHDVLIEGVSQRML